MVEGAVYAIVGRGRWAGRMRQILMGMSRRVAVVGDARRAPEESEGAYRRRIAATFRRTGATTAWLCVPPGDHVAAMVVAALDAGLDVVVEKPWQGSAAVTEYIEEVRVANGRLVAVHYEYCLLRDVEAWRRDCGGGEGLRFGGRMNVERPAVAGFPALDNLGSHLFSIREYAVPGSAIASIECSYGQPEDRRVWLDSGNSRVGEIDLLAAKEPIIQRFVTRFESARRDGEFPIDLRFAQRVSVCLNEWKGWSERHGPRRAFPT